MKESEFQAWLMNTAKVNSWLAYHTHRSDRSPAGFPDVVMVGAGVGRLIFAELKVGRNKPSKKQEEWLAALRAVAAAPLSGVGVYLWRPEDEDEIVRVLGGKRWLG